MPYEDLVENGKATRFKTGEEQAKIAAKGGIASGVARRRKRTLKQAADLAMSLPVSDKRVKAKLKKMGFDENDADNQMGVIVGLMANAMKGNPKAAALLFELLDDEHESTSNQTEAHNTLIEAIRKRNNED